VLVDETRSLQPDPPLNIYRIESRDRIQNTIGRIFKPQDRRMIPDARLERPTARAPLLAPAFRSSGARPNLHFQRHGPSRRSKLDSIVAKADDDGPKEDLGNELLDFMYAGKKLRKW
jgi:hypothetical protein